ncbi:MAG TPA: GNAT family N-acetyltransferase, partial [Puia sp.]|nr:GNAT family N-acetyltransferase [Puia sp.]
IYKDAVCELILSIQKNEFGVPITLQEQPDLNNIPNFYQKNNGNFWVALADNRVIGTISLLDIGNGQGALRKMFVHANYRGSQFGIGKRLLDKLVEWVQQKKFKEILLGTTEKFIAAQRFYEKNNFNEIEKDNLPATFPLMAVDVKFYKRNL